MNGHSQRDLLIAIKTLTSWTRDMLAKNLGASRRQLDSWMLPDGSQQRRSMPDAYLAVAQKIYCTFQDRQTRIESEDLLVMPSNIPVYETPLGIKYPRPVRVICRGCRLLEGQSVDLECDPRAQAHKYAATDEVWTHFVPPNAHVSAKDHMGNPMQIETVTGLNHPADQGHISIFKIRSDAEWDGILTALNMLPGFHQDDLDISQIEMDGQDYSMVLFKEGTLPHLDGVIALHAAAADDQRDEVVFVLPDGRMEDHHFLRALSMSKVKDKARRIALASRDAATMRQEAAAIHEEFMQRVAEQAGEALH